MSFFFGDVKTDELKIQNGIELITSSGNIVSINSHSNSSNYSLILPETMGNSTHALVLSNSSTGQLGFSPMTGGGAAITSSKLNEITEGTSESNLTTTTGNIIIYPQTGNLFMYIPENNYYSLNANNSEKIYLDSNNLISNVNIQVNDTTESSSISSGALTISGGVGINSNLNVGGNVNINESLEVSGNFTSSNTFTLQQKPITISSTQTLTLNLSEGSDYILTFNGSYDLTLAFSNANKQGQQGSIIIKTPSSGSGNLLWSTTSGIYFPSATAPTMSTGNDVYDTFSYLVVSAGVSPHILVVDSTNFQPYS
jgi:hypothetical protein